MKKQTIKEILEELFEEANDFGRFDSRSEVIDKAEASLKALYDEGEMIEIIWKEIERHTIMSHKTKRGEQHIYSICGMIDKNDLAHALKQYLEKL